MPKPRRLPKSPRLEPLRFGIVYCELCKETLVAGDRVAWWRVPAHGGRTRWAVYCETCNSANVRQRRALR